MDCPFRKIFPSALVLDEHHFMALAYNEAVEAWKEDEVPIGAAHNRTISANDPTAHAEMIAITQAANALGDWRLNECTLYVTKEPCPMCSGASVMARLGRVVFGWGDPKMGCLGGAFSLHELPKLNHRVKVVSGVMEEECRAILQAYFRMKRAEPAGE